MAPSLCRSIRSLTSLGNGRCHQKPRESEYPPGPLRQLSLKVMNVGILGIMWAIGDSQRILDLGNNFLRKNSISWRIDLVMLYWHLDWCTIFADRLMVKKMWWIWSLTLQKKQPECSDLMRVWNSGEESPRNLLFSERAYAMDVYRWVMHLRLGVLAFLWALGPPSPWIVDDGYGR